MVSPKGSKGNVKKESILSNLKIKNCETNFPSYHVGRLAEVRVIAGGGAHDPGRQQGKIGALGAVSSDTDHSLLTSTQ